jgi:ribosomal protein L29
MAEFNPDEYLQSNEFNPDEYLGVTPTVSVTAKRMPIQRPMSEELMRQAGLTGRYGLEGLGSIVDLAQAPIRGAINLAMPKDRQLQPVSLGGSIADMLGLPQPETGTERVVGDISRAIAGTGGVMKLAGGLSPTSAIGRNVATSLSANAPTQLAGAVGAGGAGGLTREAGGGEVAQMLAGLGGGMVGGALVSPKPIGLSKEQLQNINKDKLLNTAQKAGYIALPSDVGAGKGAKALETLSGKFKSEELASSKNQNVANNLTRKYLGLPESAPLNDDTFSALRDTYSEPYRLASQLPAGQVNEPTIQLLTGKPTTKPIYKSGAQIVDELKMARDDARAAWKSYNSGTANNPTELRKQAQASEKLVTQLEKQLDSLAQSANQPDLLQALNDARRNIAKVYTVEKATIGENLIDYRKIGKAIDKGAPVTGELALAGKFAKEFPRVNKPVAYEPTAFTLPDVFASGVGLGIDALTGVPFASGFPAARVGSRYLMESAPFQQRYVKPKYDPLVTPYIPYAGLLSTQNQ